MKGKMKLLLTFGRVVLETFVSALCVVNLSGIAFQNVGRNTALTFLIADMICLFCDVYCAVKDCK